MQDFALACAGWQTEGCQEFEAVLVRLGELARLSGCAAVGLPLHNAFWYRPELRASSEFCIQALAWINQMHEWAAIVQPWGWEGPRIGPGLTLGEFPPSGKTKVAELPPQPRFPV